MVAGGIMFADTGSSPAMAGGVSVAPAKPHPMHAVANRPTHLSVFRAAGSSTARAPAAHPTSGSALSSASNTNEQTGSGRSLGFRQGLLHLAKGSNPHGAQHSKGIVTKSTSAYVHRIVTNESLARWIVGDSAQATCFLFNAPRSLVWVGMQPESNGETLARLDLATSTPLCHDINHTTRSDNRLDVVLGFVHGDIIWYEPISGKYARINKNSGYSPAITCVKWIPNSDNLFIAGTSDGAVMVVDRSKDDFAVPALAHARASTFEVATPPKPRANPVSFWRIGAKPITSIAFSPDGQHVAVTSEDGFLRVIDYLNEILEDVYPSYFGGLTCCAWSDDSKYIVAGGKDDLLTVWSHHDQTVVARCQGHESWVRDVAFDPMAHEDENTYRFVSVGEDARLLFWDFSLAALHRPRAQAHRVVEPSEHSYTRGPPSDVHINGRPNDAPMGVVHSRASQGSVAMLQPLMSEIIHDTAICSLQFCQDLLVTACRRGVIKTWKRPAAFDFSTYI
ncbi:WD40-repeat-containing domain protein [Coemansia spiralis]|nr:WD40-repeat-containing domain protein [Coemansia spiralis]